MKLLLYRLKCMVLRLFRRRHPAPRPAIWQIIRMPDLVFRTNPSKECERMGTEAARCFESGFARDVAKGKRDVEAIRKAGFTDPDEVVFLSRFGTRKEYCYLTSAKKMRVRRKYGNRILRRMNVK